MPKPIQIQAFSGNVGQYSLKIRIFSDKRGCVFRDFSCWSPLLVIHRPCFPKARLWDSSRGLQLSANLRLSIISAKTTGTFRFWSASGVYRSRPVHQRRKNSEGQPLSPEPRPRTVDRRLCLRRGTRPAFSPYGHGSGRYGHQRTQSWLRIQRS